MWYSIAKILFVLYIYIYIYIHTNTQVLFFGVFFKVFCFTQKKIDIFVVAIHNTLPLLIKQEKSELVLYILCTSFLVYVYINLLEEKNGNKLDSM